MQEADAGSRGPWLQHDEFQMYFASYESLHSRFIFCPEVGVNFSTVFFLIYYFFRLIF